MPPTKKKPPPLSGTPSEATNGPTSEVLTLAEAAAYLRLSEADLIASVHAQGLPGRLMEGQWRFLKTAIQQWLSAGLPTEETRKAALLAAGGAFKDDPDLLAIVEDIYRQRGRPITEDGSYHLLHGLQSESKPK